MQGLQLEVVSNPEYDTWQDAWREAGKVIAKATPAKPEVVLVNIAPTSQLFSNGKFRFHVLAGDEAFVLPNPCREDSGDAS